MSYDTSGKGNSPNRRRPGDPFKLSSRNQESELIQVIKNYLYLSLYSLIVGVRWINIFYEQFIKYDVSSSEGIVDASSWRLHYTRKLEIIRPVSQEITRVNVDKHSSAQLQGKQQTIKTKLIGLQWCCTFRW